VTEPQEQRTPAQLLRDLTPAERRTLQALALTGSMKGAAKQLDRPFYTISDRLKSIYKKLGVNKAVLAAVIACKGGLV
jgi:DNA-binding NarL/FixJ family response regulator